LAPSPALSRPGHRLGIISLAGDDALRLFNRKTTGVIAASCTITQLLPPSLVAGGAGRQLGKSVGDIISARWDQLY